MQLQREEGNYYISGIQSKRNPDLLAPGGTLKGFEYFTTENAATTGKASEEDSTAKKVDDLPVMAFANS